MLGDLFEVLGDRQVVILKEMTKAFAKISSVEKQATSWINLMPIGLEERSLSLSLLITKKNNRSNRIKIRCKKQTYILKIVT
jgi:16S rRNA C1402 (ribose-2'-O) methylase RsmI